MTHISNYHDEIRQEIVFATPNPRTLGRGVRDFYSERDAAATPRRFTTIATPMSRKIKFAADLVAGLEEDEHQEQIEGLLNHTWQVFSVGPLFGFKVEDLDKLGPYLEQRLPPTKNKRDRIDIETVMGIRGNREDAQALKISVTREGNGFESLIFEAYLLSVEATDLDLVSKVTLLPVCLCSGDETIGLNIFLTLEKLYDTVIVPLDFTKDNLLWMSSMWANIAIASDKNASHPSDQQLTVKEGMEREKIESKKRQNDMVKFRFEMSPQMADCGIKTVDIKLDGAQVRKLWNEIHNEQESEFRVEEMEAFHQALRLQILDKTGLDTEPLVLTNFCLPVLSVARQGRVRLTNVKTAKAILRFLTGTCQGDLFSAKPGLALGEEPGNWVSY